MMAITSLQRGGRQLQLTALGRLLAQLPMDPCAANLIVQGVMMGWIDDEVFGCRGYYNYNSCSSCNFINLIIMIIVVD